MMMKYMKLIGGRLCGSMAVASTPGKLCGAPQACEGGKGTDRPENALRKTFRRQETHDRRRRAGHPAQDRRQGLLRDSVGLDGAGYAAGNDPRIDDVRARMRRRAPAAGADARRVQSGGQHRGSGAAERRPGCGRAFRSASGRPSPRSAATTSWGNTGSRSATTTGRPW